MFAGRDDGSSDVAKYCAGRRGRSEVSHLAEGAGMSFSETFADSSSASSSASDVNERAEKGLATSFVAVEPKMLEPISLSAEIEKEKGFEG